MRNGRRLFACYHEAGHALARWYFGYPTERAAVLTSADVKAQRWLRDDQGDAIENAGFVIGPTMHHKPWGSEIYKGFPDLLHHVEVTRDHYLIVLFAGMAANTAHNGFSWPLSILRVGMGDMEEIYRVLDSWYGDRDSAEWVNAYHLAERRAAALVRSKLGTAALKALVEALISRGEIDGDEIAAMCREAYGGRETGFMEWNAHWPPSLRDIRNGVIHEEQMQAAA